MSGSRPEASATNLLRVMFAGALTFAILALLPAAHASATVSGTNPCQFQPSYSWMGDSVATPVTIPSLSNPDGATSYAGAIFRPADTTTYPGARPLVVFAHGINGAMCNLFWAAQDVAGHGYTAIIVSGGGTMGDQVGQFARGLDAQQSSIAFARSPANPYLGQTDGSDIAVSGFSLGSIVASVDQQNAATDPAIKTAVAFDSLRAYVTGDPSGVSENCTGPASGLITAAVPALSFASDHPCGANPTFTPPDLKLTALRHWRDAGKPVEQLVMRGFEHTDFANAGDETQHHDLAHYLEAWLARYLGGDAHASHALAAETVNGRPVTDILSTTFLSGAYLPDLGVSSEDLSGYLAANVGPPETDRASKPSGRITVKRVKRHHLKFRFGSSQENVTFTCQLDKHDYRPCASPFVLKGLSARRHVVRVLATDPGGLVEAAPAIWRFRVRKSHRKKRHHWR